MKPKATISQDVERILGEIQAIRDRLDALKFSVGFLIFGTAFIAISLYLLSK